MSAVVGLDEKLVRFTLRRLGRRMRLLWCDESRNTIGTGDAIIRSTIAYHTQHGNNVHPVNPLLRVSPAELVRVFFKRVNVKVALPGV